MIVQPNYNLDDMDYGEMAAKIKLVAIDEIRHAEMFAGRIKELGGRTGHRKAGRRLPGRNCGYAVGHRTQPRGFVIGGGGEQGERYPPMPL